MAISTIAGISQAGFQRALDQFKARTQDGTNFAVELHLSGEQVLTQMADRASNAIMSTTDDMLGTLIDMRV